MKKLQYSICALGVLLSSILNSSAYAQQQPQQQYSTSTFSTPAAPSSGLNKIGIVNTKRCLEESKLGKQEQANFDKMQSQMESVLQEKQRALMEIQEKLDDEDYTDSLSDEAVSELKRKKRTLRDEGMQLQEQYMKTLQQAKMKSIQRITDAISKASKEVAEDRTRGALDAVVSDEACTFYAPQLDVTPQIIEKMNTAFDGDQKNAPAKPRS